MSNVHISVAAIAQLTATSPQAVHKALQQGVYGVPVQRGRNLYVPLAIVEARLGQRISPDQVARTATDNPARVVTIPTGLKWQRKRPPYWQRHRPN